MNCFDALCEQLNACEACRVHATIIEFEQLPELEKFNFDYYEKDKHYLLKCAECKIYKLLPE